MSAKPTTRNTEQGAPPEERRGAGSTGALAGAIRTVKGAMTRPIGVQRRGGRLHVVLLERRRAMDMEDPSPTMVQAYSELRARLLAHEHDPMAMVMRHLVIVHNELAHKGWSGVEMLPVSVLAKALVQAEMLAAERPSPALALFVDRLRLLKVAADIREERKARTRAEEQGEFLEVSEATQEDFEESERVWVGTIPGELTARDSGA